MSGKQAGQEASACAPKNDDVVDGDPVEEEPLVLTEEEKQAIISCRNRAAQNNAGDGGAGANADADPLEAAYADLTTVTTVFSPVHAHAAGVRPLTRRRLRSQVKAQLKLARGWDADEKKICRQSLVSTIPVLGTLIGKQNLPKPTSFSAAKVCEVYVSIVCKVLVSLGGSFSSKRRARHLSSSSSSDSSSEEAGRQAG